MKVVINTCYGRFSVSKKIFESLNLHWLGYGYLSNEIFNINSDKYYEYRAYPPLVKLVEELGDSANGDYAKLKVVEIPDGINWYLDTNDGIESIHEYHRSWS